MLGVLTTLVPYFLCSATRWFCEAPSSFCHNLFDMLDSLPPTRRYANEQISDIITVRKPGIELCILL